MDLMIAAGPCFCRALWCLACCFDQDIRSKRILFPAQQTLPQARRIHSYRFTDIDKGEWPFTVVAEDPFLRIQKFIRRFASRLKFAILKAFDGVLQNREHKSFFRLQTAAAISVSKIKPETRGFHNSRTYRPPPNIVRDPLISCDGARDFIIPQAEEL
jgi:hypothetical protein